MPAAAGGHGRLDLAAGTGGPGPMLVIIEIQGTGWDTIPAVRVRRTLRRHLRQLPACLDTAAEEMGAGRWPGGIAGALLSPARPVSTAIQEAIEALAGEQAIMVSWHEQARWPPLAHASTPAVAHRAAQPALAAGAHVHHGHPTRRSHRPGRLTLRHLTSGPSEPAPPALPRARLRSQVSSQLSHLGTVGWMGLADDGRAGGAGPVVRRSAIALRSSTPSQARAGAEAAGGLWHFGLSREPGAGLCVVSGPAELSWLWWFSRTGANVGYESWVGTRRVGGLGHRPRVGSGRVAADVAALVTESMQVRWYAPGLLRRLRRRRWHAGRCPV